MSHNVVTISPTSTVAEALELLRANEIHHLIVSEKKRVLGVLSDSDLLAAAPGRPVNEVMSREVSTIEPHETIRHAAALMNGSAVSCLPVVEDGVLTGIITTADLLRALAKGAVHLAPPSERMILRKRDPRFRLHHE